MEEIVILCMRKDEMNDPTRGSRELTCASCRKPVWLAQSTIDTVNRDRGSFDGVKLVCLECSYQYTSRPDAEFNSISDLQLKEIADHARRKGMN